MKTLTFEQCKDQVANNHGCKKWQDLTFKSVFYTEAAELYAQQFKDEMSYYKELSERQEKLMSRAIVVKDNVENFPPEIQAFAAENMKQWQSLQGFKTNPESQGKEPE